MRQEAVVAHQLNEARYSRLAEAAGTSVNRRHGNTPGCRAAFSRKDVSLMSFPSEVAMRFCTTATAEYYYLPGIQNAGFQPAISGLRWSHRETGILAETFSRSRRRYKIVYR